MRSLVLCLLVAVALSLSVERHNAHTASQARAAQQNLLDSWRPHKINAKSLQTQQACEDAIVAIQGVTCPVFTIFNQSYSYTSQEMNDMITAHCVGANTCADQLQSLLDDVVAGCADVISDPAFWHDIGAAYIFNAVPCLQVSTEPDVWCLVEFNDFIDRLATADANPLTAQDLNDGCTLCTAATLAVWLAFETNWDSIFTTAYIDLICLKVESTPNDWCYLKFQELIAFTDSVKANGEDPFLALSGQSDTYCLECDFAFLHKWKNIYALYAVATQNSTLGDIYTYLQTIEVIYAFACVEDPEGNNCMIKVTSTSTTDIDAACEGVDDCSGSCGDAVSAFVNELGCCLDTWFDFLTWICLVDPTNEACPDIPLNFVSAYIEDVCGVDIKPGCGENYHLGLYLIAENLGWIWCFNNNDACLNLIKDNIAYQLAIARDDLDAAGVQIILAQSQEPARRLLADSVVEVRVEGLSTKNGVGWITQTSGSAFGVPYDARVVTDESVTFTTVDAIVTYDGAAAGVAPSIVALFLAFAVLFL